MLVIFFRSAFIGFILVNLLHTSLDHLRTNWIGVAACIGIAALLARKEPTREA